MPSHAEAICAHYAAGNSSQLSGDAGTADLNVPMFIALRRFTLLCTVILERSLLHKQHDRATMGAVGLMIGGLSPSKHACATMHQLMTCNLQDQSVHQLEQLSCQIHAFVLHLCCRYIALASSLQCLA